MLSKELLEKTVAEAIDITRNQYAKQIRFIRWNWKNWRSC